MPNAVDAILDGLDEAIARGLAEAGAAGVEAARARVPVRTGALYRSIGFRRGGGLGAEFFAGAPYAGFVEARSPFLAPASAVVEHEAAAAIEKQIGRLAG